MAEKTALVVCEALTEEIAGRTPAHVETHVIELGQHDYPKKLHQELQDVINGLEQDHCYESILLGFGLCSESIVGLEASRAKLVAPRTDDCTAILLGSMDAYREQFQKAPGTYYYTKKNIDKGWGPLAMYLGQHEWTKKYDQETAQWVAREMIKNYTRIALIDTGIAGLAACEEYARQAAEVFGLQYELLKGTAALLEQLLHGPWDEQFVVAKAGQRISRSMFYHR